MRTFEQNEQNKDILEKSRIRTMSKDLKEIQTIKKVPSEKKEPEKEKTTTEEKIKEEVPKEEISKKEETIKAAEPTKFIEHITPPEKKSERELSPQERLAYGVEFRRPKPVEKPPSAETSKSAPVKVSKRPSIFEFLKRAPKHPELSKLNALVKSKKFLALIILVFAISIGSFLYYRYYYSPPLPSSPVIPEPAAIIPIENKIVITYSEGENLLAKVETKLRRMSNLPEISRLNIKNQNGYYLDLKDITEKLNIKIPEELAANIKDYNLLVFSLKDEGLRLGLVFEVADIKLAESYTRSWERKMKVNLRTLFLHSYVKTPARLNFQNGVYQNVSIRYLNLPNPFVSIDYAFVGNKLIITTSKASIYKIIDIIK